MKKLISTLILMTVGFASVNAQNNAESLYTDYRTDLIGTFKDNINDVIVTTAKYFLNSSRETSDLMELYNSST